MSIDELLGRIAEGDNGAFERLYLETRRGVFAFLLTYLHNHHDAEDAMQSTYLKIKRSIHSFDPRGNGRAWMLEIAKNTALNIIRDRSRADVSEDPTLFAKDAHSSQSGAFMIEDLMERVLDPEERRIIVLHVLFGYRHREIGEQLGLPTGTVTSKYKRATEKLRRAMGEAN